MSHNFKVLSSEPEATNKASREKRTVLTQLECPNKLACNFLSLTLINFTVLSSAPVAINNESQEISIAFTGVSLNLKAYDDICFPAVV